MERNLERQTLSFSKGMTNVPSDLLSDDSELLESDGFIFKDGEMKAVQKPVCIGNAPCKIMHVHKMADYKNLICWNGNILFWTKINEQGKIVENFIELADITGDTVYDIKSVNSTLIVATSYGVLYLLFKGGNYISLGYSLPEPEFVPYMEEVPKDIARVSDNTDMNGIVKECTLYGFKSKETGEFLGYYDGTLFLFPDDAEKAIISGKGYAPAGKDKIQDYLNAVQGSVSKQINYAREKNYFCFPFFVRYALKLYDGTYTRISNPIVCYPTISRNYDGYIDGNKQLISKVKCAKLEYTANIPGIEYWKDIVKELVVFASKEVIPYRSLSSTEYMDWQCEPEGISSKPELLTVGINYVGGSTYEGNIRVNYKTDKEIIDDLVSNSQFYKLAVLSINNKGDFPTDHKELPIKYNVVSTLETQEQLKVDDYYGWTNKVFKKMFEYNSRINVFDYERFPFKGFNTFNPVYILEEDTTAGSGIAELEWVRYYVHIVSDKMDTWVVSDKKTFNVIYKRTEIGKDLALNRLFADWVYYPDPNAKEMFIEYFDSKHNTSHYVHNILQKHPLLNGAYSFFKLPAADNTLDNYEHEDMGNTDFKEGGSELFDSGILSSVVNNPFVFEASGDNTVGTGKILGIMANTEAVSQGQFGQYPLMVFTDEGIYGLSVNSEGLYSRAYPISREVCNDDSPLVPTDRLVFFASKKGLMAASGGSVACMSEQMRGRVPRNFATFGEGKFLDFLKDCFIAYDYRDSILRIFSKGKSYQYIYNMVDKTFSMVNSGIEAQAVVNDYPDNLIQDTNGNVYSLTSKPDINEDTESYSGSFTTRPLKLGGSMTLKSLRAVKHLFDSDEGTIGLEIYGSNDCKHWCKLPSVGGKPWKYFTFKYTLQNFKAADSFAGSIVEVQSRREDKMR